MAKAPRISETEWEVMRIVWADPPKTSSEIIEILQGKDPSWHPKTAKTLINRLVKKKALTFTQDGRAYLYRPAVSKRVCVESVSRSFLDRVFGGSLQPMLAHFVERSKLSEKELKELRKILNDKQ